MRVQVDDLVMVVACEVGRVNHSRKREPDIPNSIFITVPIRATIE